MTRRRTTLARPVADVTPKVSIRDELGLSEHDAAFCASFGPWLEAEAAREPFKRGEAVLVDAESAPKRTTRLSVAGWLRAGGCSKLARELERLRVADGHVAVVAIGDYPAIFSMRVDDLGRPSPPPNDAHDGAYVAGEPWRRGRWILPISHVRPLALKGGG